MTALVMWTLCVVALCGALVGMATVEVGRIRGRKSAIAMGQMLFLASVFAHFGIGAVLLLMH